MDAALAAAQQWQIAPPRMNGAPVVMMQNIAVTFREP